jgi:hypothetical protein
MVKYQSMLCENLHAWLEVVNTLNPATQLWVNSGPPQHDSLEIMDEVFSSQPGLTNQPNSHLDIEYFTDGNSFVQKYTHFGRYALFLCPLSEWDPRYISQERT